MADTPIEGIDGEPLTYAQGKKILPAEWYDEAPTQEISDMMESRPPEAVYAASLRYGFPRDPAIEATLDLSQIPPELLNP